MEPDNSHIKIGKRVKKRTITPLKWQEIDTIPVDEACILALPGSGADTDKKANGFSKMIEEILKDKKFPIYCAVYNLGNRLFRIDREAVLARYGQQNDALPYIHSVSKEDMTYVPQYIRELYQKSIAPRLRDDNGNKITIEKIAQRLNMLVFVNHCQGSTVMMQLEHLTIEDMKQLGYEDNTQSYLLRQIHSVNIAPVSPYGVTQTTSFKFVSLSDDRATSVHTKKIAHILKRKKEYLESLSNSKEKYLPFNLQFSLTCPSENETVFIVNNLYSEELQKIDETDLIEHTFDSYATKEDSDRTKDGDKLSETFRLTLNWLCENANKNKQKLHELPNIFKQPIFNKYIGYAQENRNECIIKEIHHLRENKSR